VAGASARGRGGVEQPGLIQSGEVTSSLDGLWTKSELRATLALG